MSKNPFNSKTNNCPPPTPPCPAPPNHGNLGNWQGGNPWMPYPTNTPWTPQGVPQYPKNPIDPIYSNKYFIEFDIDKKDNKILKNSITALNSTKMTFGASVMENGVLIPFDIIIKYLSKKINVSLDYKNRDGVVLYKFILVNFEFKKFLNLLDIKYDTEDLEFLEIGIAFEKLEYINYMGKKNQRLNKVSNILEDKDFSTTVNGEFFDFKL